MHRNILLATIASAAIALVAIFWMLPESSPSRQTDDADQTGQAAVQKAAPDEGASCTTQDIWVDASGGRIYGKAYLPDSASPAPLVILSHGFGGTHADMAPYAQRLAEHGYAAYTFDFRGGSESSQSDGETTDMSVMTEAQDLEAVIEAARTWDFADASRIVLAGGSQGGMVSAVVAARHPEIPQALVLFYPAFSIVDDVHAAFPAEDAIPETYSPLAGWMTVGRRYATDVWDYDVFSEIGAYTGPVLIVHGDADTVVDLSYSQRAADVYADAELEVIPGAGHGFTGDALEEAEGYALSFLDEHVGAGAAPSQTQE